MKVTYLKSATIIVEHKGKKVLCDPWLSDGVYYGSWCHYPPLEFSPFDIPKPDAIYISHIHPDHFSVEDLIHFDKNIPILIHRFQERFLRKNLRRLGFKEVIELRHGEAVSIGEDFQVQIYASDDCNPEVCGKFFGCQWMGNYTGSMQIDSLAVFSSSEHVVVNTNDCQYDLAGRVCDKIIKEHGKVDLLLAGYSSASPYPQCYLNYSHDERKKEQALIIDKFHGKAAMYANRLKPEYLIPFAGQYCLGGKLWSFNEYLAQPNYEEAPQAIIDKIEDFGYDSCPTRVFACSPFDTFDLSQPEMPQPPKPYKHSRVEYARMALANRKFTYEHDKDPDLLDEDWLGIFKEALRFMRVRMEYFKEVKAKDWKVYIAFGDNLVVIPIAEGDPEFVKEIDSKDQPYLLIEVDPRLLLRIMHRSCHWNNAEVGSHLRFYREPDVYERSLFFFLCFFHLPHEAK